MRWEREGSDKRCCLLPWEPANATGAAWGGDMGLPLAGPCGHHSLGRSVPVSFSGHSGQGERVASHRSTLGGQLRQDRGVQGPAAQDVNPVSTARQQPGLSRSLPGPL